jgi:copper/silver efflux system protein
VTRGLVAFSTRRPWIVLVCAIVLALAGELAWRGLGRDAIPDLSNPQIVLVADWMGHPAAEVAQRITSVLTRTLDGLPGVTAVRGSSMSGMAYVDVVFERTSDLERGRQEVVERIGDPRQTLPQDVRLQIGPVASSTGWVFQYVLVDPHRRQSGLLLRRFQDGVLKPALAAIPGVAEVASLGGSVPEVLVELEADRLRANAVATTDVVAALRARLAREPVVAKGTELAELPVAAPSMDGGNPMHVGDVGHVHVTEDMPTGLGDFRGIQPAVGGIVVARRDADISGVVEAVRRVLESERAKLAPGVELVTAYDRSDLIARVGSTLRDALGEEVAVVVIVTLGFLLHWRSAAVPMLTIPLVLLITFGAMWVARIPATIMSLGGIGIALGIAVDADVVALEACHRRLESAGPASSGDRRAHLIAAASSFAPAILTSLLITALAFLPVLAFTGESGSLLRPLALTKTLIVVAAALVSVTVAPALRERLLVGSVPPEFANPVTRALVAAYRPFVHFALSRPALTLATAALALLSCVPIISHLGREFLPRMDEGDLLFMPTTLPGAAPAQSATELFRQDRALREFAEVTAVFGKVGRADTATDPAPYSMAETTIRLRPQERWPALRRTRWYSGWAPLPLREVLGLVWPEATRETPAELVERLDRATRLPGWVSAWTAPARARMDMMATGVRTPVGIRIVASDPARLEILGTALRTIVSRVPGTRGAAFESFGGEPVLDFEPDDGALSRLHVDPAAAADLAHLFITGGQVGEITVDGQRARVRVAPDENMHAMMMSGPGEPLRGGPDRLREATVRASDGGPPVPLSLLGRVGFSIQPAQIRTERGETVNYVYSDLVDGTDLAGYVDRGRREVSQAQAAGEIQLAPGERIEWTGQYELLTAGERRLEWIAPLVMLSMLGLLWLQFRNLTEGLIVLVSVPFALVGSCWTLFLLGIPLSAPVWVGLLSTVGLAMQTGVVMVVYIDEAFYQRVHQGRLRTREDIVEAHAEGTVRRLRPKVMTVTTMAATLVPLVSAHGAGSEIMRRVAAPMLGGLVTSALLTLEVLPVIYTIWRSRQLRRADRAGVPIEAVVGRVPTWARRNATPDESVASVP